MTDKFKKRVREHAKKHNMSYQAARQQLEQHDEHFAYKLPPPNADLATETLHEAFIAWYHYAKGLEEQLEQLHVQLAGCSVAAWGGAKGDNDAGPGDYGHSVPFDDVKHLRQRHDEMLGLVSALWSLLDDTDSANDIAKDDDALYRSLVEKIQKKRWDTGVVTDGHHVFVKGWPADRRPGWIDTYDPHNAGKGRRVLDGISPDIFKGTYK